MILFILTQILVFHATFCLFQHASWQSHHSTTKWVECHLSSRIPATCMPNLQCGAAWGSVLTLDFKSHDCCSSHPPVQIRHLYSLNAKFWFFGRLRLWIWLWDVFRLKCQVWLRVESHWLLLLAKRLDSSGSALRAWMAKPGRIFKLFVPVSILIQSKISQWHLLWLRQNVPVTAWRLWLFILLEPSFCTVQRACLIRSHRYLKELW